MIEKNTVFISHITEDKEYAKAIKDWLDKAFLNALNFFVSSDNSSMPIGKEWASEIKLHLEKASIMFVIISDLSVERKWLYFESGSAYVKNIPVIPICVNGYKISKLSPPLSFFQGIELPNERDEKKLLEVLANEVGLYVPNPPYELKLIERDATESTTFNKEESDLIEKDAIIEAILTKKNTLTIINSINPDIVNTINELLFVMNLNEVEDYEEDYEGLLKNVKKEFATNRLISKSGLIQLIDEINKKLSSIKSKNKDDSDANEKRTMVIKKTTLEQLPSKQECKERILNYPSEVWLAVIAYKYYFGYSFEAEEEFKEEMLELLIDKDYGKKILPIIEDVLFREEPESDIYNRLISTARAILANGFDNWFYKLKGMTYEEEIKKYNDLQFARRERRIKEEQLDYERHRLHLERRKLQDLERKTIRRKPNTKK